ncbi:hypothetical protein TSUD_98270 [Trifolium subterraneum]|uniref:DUF4283 domain-containing protein n=1 Tax=Trifolium subterraneum TaxID=3900 RepID=A0A2Z6LXG2_TRISU|nr:hypothetical protein TSUD_98270 [Trifolium subterraneum]
MLVEILEVEVAHMEEKADDPKVSSMGDDILDNKGVHCRDSSEPTVSLVGVSIPQAATNLAHLNSDTESVGTTMPLNTIMVNNTHELAGASPLVDGAQSLPNNTPHLPGRKHHLSGSWSFERLQDPCHFEADIIFSPLTKKKLKRRNKTTGGHSQGSGTELKRKKAGGVLSHTMHNLRRAARLPGKDRREVLKILKREVRKRSGKTSTKNSVEVSQQGMSDSGSSMDYVNKDLEHWVVMHGNQQVVAEDVRGFGAAIGIKSTGEGENMFSVLVRGGRDKKQVKNVAEGEGVDEGGWGVWRSGMRSTHSYSYRPSLGASGRLLIMWDEAEVEVWSSVSFNHVLMIHGRFLKSHEEFFLFNVYAPCDNNAKRVMGLADWKVTTVRVHLYLHDGFYKVPKVINHLMNITGLRDYSSSNNIHKMISFECSLA